MAKKPHPGQLNTQCAMYSACITVLNWGLGPHEDLTAETVKKGERSINQIENKGEGMQPLGNGII